MGASHRLRGAAKKSEGMQEILYTEAKVREHAVNEGYVAIAKVTGARLSREFYSLLMIPVKIRFDDGSVRKMHAPFCSSDYDIVCEYAELQKDSCGPLAEIRIFYVSRSDFDDVYQNMKNMSRVCEGIWNRKVH